VRTGLMAERDVVHRVSPRAAPRRLRNHRPAKPAAAQAPAGRPVPVEAFGVLPAEVRTSLRVVGLVHVTGFDVPRTAGGL
jgi:hypothetical protein